MDNKRQIDGSRQNLAMEAGNFQRPHGFRMLSVVLEIMGGRLLLDGSLATFS